MALNANEMGQGMYDHLSEGKTVDVATKTLAEDSMKKMAAGIIEHLEENNEVFHDSTLEGTGTETDPLTVVGGGGLSKVIHNDTLGGEGTPSDPLYAIAFGNATACSNANNLTLTGIFRVTSSTTNIPEAANGFLLNTQGSTISSVQVLWYDNGASYIRSQISGSWGAWSKSWNETNDGSGSGLDADLLQGRDGTVYASNYLSTRTYSINEPCFYLGVPYKSLQNSNIDHTPDSSPTYWEVTGGGLSGWELTEDTDGSKLLTTPFGVDLVPIDDDGNFTFNGLIKATTIRSTSTRNSKTNIGPSSVNAVEMINNTKICDFNFKTDTISRIGFIAEDTHSLLSIDHTGMDHANCIGLLLKAVQELSQEVTTLKKRLM